MRVIFTRHALERLGRRGIALENLSISIDPEADAAYVTLSAAKVARTEEVGEGILVDYDSEGRPVGVEVLSR
jgi:Protein of unknown function (DUF2283)